MQLYLCFSFPTRAAGSRAKHWGAGPMKWAVGWGVCIESNRRNRKPLTRRDCDGVDNVLSACVAASLDFCFIKFAPLRTDLLTWSIYFPAIWSPLFPKFSTLLRRVCAYLRKHKFPAWYRKTLLIFHIRLFFPHSQLFKKFAFSSVSFPFIWTVLFSRQIFV